MIPSIEGWTTKANEAPSPHEVRLIALETNPVFLCLWDIYVFSNYNKIYEPFKGLNDPHKIYLFLRKLSTIKMPSMEVIITNSLDEKFSLT